MLFASIHQYPFYPGTGRARATSAPGAGEGYSLNLPVPGGLGRGASSAALVEHVVLPAARAFDPDLVLVSAGFDAHRDDPLGELRARDAARTRELARQVARRSACRSAYVLEGGYDLDALAHSVAATMEALGAGGEPRSHPRGELVERAVARARPDWSRV